MATSITGVIVKEYIKKWPKLPNRTLANLVYKENPAVFNSFEHARDTIRYYTGSHGDKHRKSRGLKESTNPFFMIPESEERIFEPYILPLGDYKMGWMSDPHFPYHSKSSIEITVKEFKRIGVNVLLLMGDIWDCYNLSKFEKDPRSRDTAYELKLVGHFLDFIAEYLPKAQIYLLEGNHEYRLESYLQRKAPELIGCEFMNWKSILKLPQRGIEFINEKRRIKYDNLNLFHGHEVIVGSGTNKPAEKLYQVTKANSICGHLHRTSSHSETNVDGKTVSTWTVGHLSETHPKYMPYNRWNHGFAWIETSGKDWIVYNHKIIEGKIN